MPKVLISDKLSPAAVAIFTHRGIEADVQTGLTPEQLKAIIGNYDGLAIRSSTTVTPDILSAATNLKVVGRAGIGVDNVDLKAATAKGVVVMNTPFGNSITTAEHAIAMMFAIARDLPQASASTNAGKWEKSKFMGVELTGKTLAIIGCGNIGAIVANRALGLSMKIVAFDPFLTEDNAHKMGIEKVSFDDAIKRADFITLHTPLNDKTRNMLDKVAFARMKKGVRIINCARGGLIVEADLKEALDSGHVAGAALDVFEVEPAKENILFGHPHFIATPHLGASTTEAQENVALQVAEQISDFLLTGAVVNAVNMPSVSAEQARQLKPYLQLSEMLGSLAGQLTESGIKTITITYSGKAAALNTKPLTATLLSALLSPLLDSVNVVNAGVLAKERGIETRETLDDSDKRYANAISLTVETEKRTRTVTGTVFAGTTPRLVEMEGIPIEAEVGKHILFVRNQDKPGFIGRLGSALGDANINIATFQLGRTAPGQDAIALIEVDQPLPPALVTLVANLPNVVQAKQLTF
jgi:D-3-phosphoglycerate dehydrogenase / 2-oxoglutarate reductase